MDNNAQQPMKSTWVLLAVLFLMVTVGLTTSPISAHSPTPATPAPTPDPDQEPDCNSQKEGQPVALYSGRERHRETDMVVDGAYPIRLVRQYDSRTLYDSPLGYGWAFYHDMRIFEYPDNSAVLRVECGVRYKFLFTGGAYTLEANGPRGELTRNPDGSFVFTHLNGAEDRFDSQGLLIRKQDQYGNYHIFTYTTSKQDLWGTSPHAVDPTTPIVVAKPYHLLSIAEHRADDSATGNSVTFTYYPNTGRLHTATDNQGRVITYTFDTVNDAQAVTRTSGNLVKAEGLEGRQSHYRYEDAQDAHNLTEWYKTDSDGTSNESTHHVNIYNADDRVSRQTYGHRILDFDYVVPLLETKVTETITDENGENPQTAVRTYKFNERGYLTSLRDSLGQLTKHSYNSNDWRTGTELYEPDGAGGDILLQSATEEYDTQGNRTQRTVTLDSGELITMDWTYDNGWVESEETVSSARPSEIFRTEYTFYRDGGGKPTNIKEEKRRRADGTFQVVTYTYNGNGVGGHTVGPAGTGVGEVATMTYPDGVKKVYLYENNDRYVTRIHWEDSAGAVLPDLDERFDYDGRGNRIERRDAKNQLTQYAYDNQNRLTTITNPLNQATIFTYDDRNLIEIERGRVGTNEGQVFKLLYDGKDQLTDVQRKQPDGTFATFTTYAYDSRGKRLSSKDALNRTTTFGYDLKGQLTRITDPLSNVTTYEYDAAGNRNKLTDALDRVTVYRYDDLNRLIEIEQQGITPSALTTLGYDAVGNLLSVTDPESNTTTYSYDALSRKTGETRPGTESLTYRYDTRDRLDELVFARGQKLKYRYKDWGGVDNIRFYSTDVDLTADPGAAVARTQTFGYDLNGNRTTSSDSAVGAGTLYTTTHDALDRPDTVTAHYLPGGSDRVLDHDYDRYGNRNTLAFSDGGSTYTHSYTYNTLNRLTDAVLDGHNYSLPDTSAYDAADQLKAITYPNGVQAAITYRDNGPVETISYSKADSSPLESIAYTYDKALNVDTRTDNDGTYDYDYDGLDRLTQADYPPSTSIPTDNYVYDNVGNREDSANPSLWDYNSNNQLTTGPDYTYLYDDDGNTTDKTPTASNPTGQAATLTYDLINRLSTYSSGTTSAVYLYDADGRRIKKTVNGTITWYLWDGTQLLAEYSETAGVASLQKRYAYLPNRYAPSQMTDSTGTYFIHSDHLDTPKLITDNTETVVWRIENQAFGESMPDEDPDNNGQVVMFNVRFPGQYWDNESKIHQNYFRDYDPSIGRYIETDPIGLRGGLNTFAYAAENPIRLSDPFGLTTYSCKRPLQGFDFMFGPLHHQYICVTTPNGYSCQSTNAPPGYQDSIWPKRDPGVPSDPKDDRFNPKACEEIDDDDDYCVERCLQKQWAKPRPPYGIGGTGTDCQEYSHDTFEDCKKICK